MNKYVTVWHLENVDVAHTKIFITSRTQPKVATLLQTLTCML